MDPDAREAELERVRATYAAYESEGRSMLWNPSNRGYSRMMRDRDAALLDVISDATKPGSRLADLGCGTGDLAALVARLRLELAGVDLRPEAIAAARARYPSHAWYVASVDALPFDDGAFDVVVASTLFSSLGAELQVAAAREIGRILRPGGTVAWYDLRYGNPSNPAVHGVTRTRIARLFPRWTVEVRPLTLLPPVARRLGPLTPMAYPALHFVRPLRTHLVGRLVRP